MDVQRGQEDVDLYDDFDLRKQLTPLQSRDKKRKIMPINQWKAPLIEMKILLRKYSYFHQDYSTIDLQCLQSGPFLNQKVHSVLEKHVPSTYGNQLVI